jgi:hypothetical protein
VKQVLESGILANRILRLTKSNKISCGYNAAFVIIMESFKKLSETKKTITSICNSCLSLN